MRADVYLTENGFAPSRRRAQELIANGCVTIDGKPVAKPAFPVTDGEHAVTVRDQLRYVGRGGLKLEAALDAFGLDVTGVTALDIGASTGGFTDCLLQRGAAKVYAVDAGSDQLAQKLREDPRVVSMEKCNARELTRERLCGASPRLIVMDVSFISATYLIPLFPDLLDAEGNAICLIKPQFEVGPRMLGKGGIVRDPRARLFAVERVLCAGREAGLLPAGLIPSPISGGDGNREFLVLFTRTSGARTRGEVTPERIRQVCFGKELNDLAENCVDHEL